MCSSDLVPVIFQAEHTGAVRIDGADTTRTTGATTVSYATDATGVDAWEPTEIGGAIVYSHRWVDELGQPIDLGFFPNPFGPSVDYGIVARRRETAFIDDRLLRQVMCKSDLAPGTFYVSDASMGTGYVYPYPLVDTAGQVIYTVPRRTCTEAAPDHRIYVVPFGDEPGGWEHATFATTFRSVPASSRASLGTNSPGPSNASMVGCRPRSISIRVPSFSTGRT